MPRHRSIKYICFEAIVFVGLLALVGHLSVNFWERFVIQSELTQMKTSLHSLKETLANIGTAYDNLHKELKGLVEITEKHNSALPSPFKPEPQRTWKLKHTLDRRRLHDIQVQAMLLAQKNENSTKKVNKTTGDNVRTENKKLEAIIQHYNPAHNATTITRYPPKSTAVGQDLDTENIMRDRRYKNTVYDEEECYRDDQFHGHYHNEWRY